LAARLIGIAAMAAGCDVRGSETIGMAQRGGSVVSHVRMVAEGVSIASPLIGPGGADAVIAFEPGEAARAASFLKPHGVLLTSDRALIPAVAGDYDQAKTLDWLRATTENLYVLSGADIIATCGARALNVTLLGAASALGVFPFARKDLEDAIRSRLPRKSMDSNLAALAYGESLIQQQSNTRQHSLIRPQADRGSVETHQKESPIRSYQKGEPET
jgi:indolepyruvate ferredoxin oxidoreductase beta subunit